MREEADRGNPASARARNAGEVSWWARARWRSAAFCLFFAVLMVAMQYRSGAYSADLAFDPDEPAHAVSSLMVHDYLAHGLTQNPMTFAKNFAAHYRKVAIGHWPPLLYCAEGVWMLVLGRSRVAMLLFIALCAAALVSSVFFVVKRRTSAAAALVSVAVLMHLSIFREMVFCVRPEIPLTLLVFWAAVYCGKYMQAPTKRNRNLFIAFSVSAFLVHGRAAELLLLPFCLLPLRRGRVSWKWAIAALCVAPLFLLPNFMYASNPFSVALILPEAWAYMKGAGLLTGWLGVALAVCGLTRLKRNAAGSELWATMAGLALSGLVFYVLLPVQWDYRYLVPTLAALAVLAGGGVCEVFDRVREHRPLLQEKVAVITALAAVAWMIASTVNMPHKPDFGYHRLVADGVLHGRDVILIAANGVDEGGLIVEAALTDPKLEHTVLRASKVLAHSDWGLNGFRLLYRTPAEVMGALDREKVSMVLLKDDSSLGQVMQLHALFADNPAGWRRMDMASAPEGMKIYVRETPAVHDTVLPANESESAR